jgi:hypothetical protein
MPDMRRLARVLVEVLQSPDLDNVVAKNRRSKKWDRVL